MLFVNKVNLQQVSIKSQLLGIYTLILIANTCKTVMIYTLPNKRSGIHFVLKLISSITDIEKNDLRYTDNSKFYCSYKH